MNQQDQKEEFFTDAMHKSIFVFPDKPAQSYKRRNVGNNAMALTGNKSQSYSVKQLTTKTR